MKVTTLYAALERLEREGLILTDGEEVVNGRARRYYRITDRAARTCRLRILAAAIGTSHL